jgi:succinate dehydrogenase / fumarate reductase cytochrome b subunit
VLAFLGLHIYDFWVHEMAFKYVAGNPENPTRYYAETVEKFEPVWRTVIYVVAFVLLAIHLWHGFASSIQTMGWNDKYNPLVKRFTRIYAVVIPMGFIIIALYHHFNPITH